MLERTAFMQGIYIFLLTVLQVTFTVAEVKSVSACHSSGEPNCDYVTLECGAGSRIRLLNMKYGYKNYSCSDRRNRCLSETRGGCCSYAPNDCTEYYNQLHAYNLHRFCSGKQSCKDLPVPNKVLASCPGSPVSTYVYLEYECVADNTFLNICDIGKLNASSVNILYDSNQGPNNCSCFVKSSTNLLMDLVDVQLTNSYTSEPGSSCSSASLVIEPYVNARCDSAKDEADNFVYAVSKPFTVSPVEVKLLNLGLRSPEFIWINVVARDQQIVDAVCFMHAGQSTYFPSTSQTTPSTDTNTTQTGASGELRDGVNTGAVVTGVLVPILVLLAALIVFLIVRRRRKLEKKQTHLSSNLDIENSVENNEYAEIGFVPDGSGLSNKFDPDLKQNRSAREDVDASSWSGHTYQNTGGESGVKRKKGPLEKLSVHTNRLISFFKKRTEHDLQSPQPRSREASGGSYDHLHPGTTTATSNKTVETKVSMIEQKHPYAHTVNHTANENAASSVARKENNDRSPQAGNMPHNVSAVDVGDAYIEFQVCDGNTANLLKSREKDTSPKDRPAIPNRPPPLPSAVAKLRTAENNKIPETSKDTRSKSPNLLSPNMKAADTPMNYDYATEHVHSRSASNASSNISSEHSYKILEPQQPVYDYADVSDGECDGLEDTAGTVYEDVEKAKPASSRKHKSAADAQYSSDGYLAPITTRARRASNPTK